MAREMTMRLVIGFFAVMMLVATPVQAIDGAGIYKSMGSRSCGQWLEAKKEDDDHRYSLRDWVAGYVTATNVWMEGKQDWLEDSDLPSAMLWIDKYCRENPLSNSVSAMRELMRELGVRR